MGNGIYRHVPPAGDRTANIFFAGRALRRGYRLMLSGQLHRCIVDPHRRRKMLLTQPSKSFPASVHEGARYQKQFLQEQEIANQYLTRAKLNARALPRSRRFSLTADRHSHRALPSRAMTREDLSIYTS
jgi:hypothetical protein